MADLFNPLFDFLALLLNFFFSLWPDGVDYGLAIVMLTIVVLLVAMPLTFKQTKSMISMQRIQPEIKALQAKYKDDRERLNQETMALYQAHGVNPLGGCLPLIVQIPLFLVLFNVVRGITRRVTETGLAFGSAGFARGFETVALSEGNPTGYTPMALEEFERRNFNPAFLNQSDEMFQALIERNDMPSFGFDLARSARQSWGDGLTTVWPYVILIAIVFVTSIVQQRQMRGRRDPNAASNPQQEMIMKVMPFLLPVFSFNFAAAVVVYFVVSNLFRVGQQAIITRQFYSDDAKEKLDAKLAATRANMPDPDTKPSPNSNSKSARANGSKGGAKGRAGGGGDGGHGSRRPTSRAPRKRLNVDSGNNSGGDGAKSSGRPARPRRANDPNDEASRAVANPKRRFGRKRRTNDPKNKSDGDGGTSERAKPVKPQKKSSSRVTPKNDSSSSSSRRRRGK